MYVVKRREKKGKKEGKGKWAHMDRADEVENCDIKKHQAKSCSPPLCLHALCLTPHLAPPAPVPAQA